VASQGDLHGGEATIEKVRGSVLTNNRNVLVTGGAGYIGSHACKALAGAGFIPIAYDNLASGHEWAVRWGPIEKGDILDQARLNEVFKTYRPSAVMHFAAHAYVGESVEEPAKYYRNNVAGSLSLLEAMREHDVSQIVFSSSCATYGVPKAIPIAEKHPQNPINPYGASKLMIERMLADFGAAYGLRSISLRYFNAAGADPDGEIGEDHDPETHLIPLVLEAAARKRSNITIFGTDYDTPDGTCIRDYVHVTDLAEAHVLALRALRGSCNSASYNLGTGNGFSVGEVIQTAREITGRSISAKGGLRRPGDPSRLMADATRAKNELGWKPQYGDLHPMIATAWNWIITRQPGNAAVAVV
jgi:UDP-arabinose 4-epimerase